MRLFKRKILACLPPSHGAHLGHFLAIDARSGWWVGGRMGGGQSIEESSIQQLTLLGRPVHLRPFLRGKKGRKGVCVFKPRFVAPADHPR